MKELPKKYHSAETEARWQSCWEQEKTYAWESDLPREDTYVIDTPPPTVSGLLHMGHIFSYTQADFIARYQRMKGKTVFYPMGFDDNGLPTERLVEKVKKIRAADLPREEFIAVCKEVVQEAEEEFRRLFQSVALSVDWDQEYQTISERSRKISQMSFLDLFHKKQAYRTMEPTLWDPADRTALAQAEIEDKEMPSTFNDVTFTLEDGTPVTIATTRPELIPACVALFCHPEDGRYTQYIGKQAYTALFGVKVPVLADAAVDREKGTGLVMCCTFGDQTDVHWWKTHNLPLRVVLDKSGRLVFAISEEKGAVIFESASGFINSDNCKDINTAIKYFEKLQGLTVKKAREAIIELLKEQGLLTKQEDITHAVKCAERSGCPLEILVTPQWFIRVMDKKEALLEKAAACTWYPAHMKTRMDNWIEGLSWDWCISRQRYFGVPFPVWYSKRAGEEGRILVAETDQLPVNPLVDLPKGYSREEVEPDFDVMDTWATSSVSPQLSSHGISDAYAIDGSRHEKLFPADLRPQAHEIIRTWAFYTLAKAHLHGNTIPWRNLMISGWCLAADKTKMSKSKGNVVTPVNLIQEKGADVVRYWASTSKLGMDTAFSEDVLKIGHKLVNKLWNASKFAAIQLGAVEGEPVSASRDTEDGIIYETLDLWVLTRLRRAVEKADRELARYEYSSARAAAEEFFWKDFCDNYLEMVKKRAYNEDGSDNKGQQSAAHTIYHCLDGILRLFAPFLPHITEELYSHIFDARHQKMGSVHARGTWPVTKDYPLHEEAERSGIAGVAVLDAVRKLKAEKNVSVKWPLKVVEVASGEEKGSWDMLKPCAQDLKNVMNAHTIEWTQKGKGGAILTDDGAFLVAAEFGEESDAA